MSPQVRALMNMLCERHASADFLAGVGMGLDVWLSGTLSVVEAKEVTTILQTILEQALEQAQAAASFPEPAGHA